MTMTLLLTSALLLGNVPGIVAFAEEEANVIVANGDVQDMAEPEVIVEPAATEEPAVTEETEIQCESDLRDFNGEETVKVQVESNGRLVSATLQDPNRIHIGGILRYQYTVKNESSIIVMLDMVEDIMTGMTLEAVNLPNYG